MNKLKTNIDEKDIIEITKYYKDRLNVLVKELAQDNEYGSISIVYKYNQWTISITTFKNNYTKENVYSNLKNEDLEDIVKDALNV